jgi:hypothetical protein
LDSLGWPVVEADVPVHASAGTRAVYLAEAVTESERASSGVRWCGIHPLT